MSNVDTTVPDETIDLEALEVDILEALSIGDTFACVEGNDEQIREVQAAPAKVRALAAEVRRLTTDRALTHAQAVQACANVGVDLTCGACAAVFYTGVGSPHDVHTCAGRDESDALRRSTEAAIRETGALRDGVTDAIGLAWRPIPQPFGATAYACPDDRDIIEAVRAVVKERDEVRAQVERLTDLVRHQRGALHIEGLITDAEYADLAGLTGSPARLEGYDALRGELALQKRATNAAIGERDEARADVAWLTEEVTQQTGATVDSVAEGLALARAGGIHRPVVNVRMGDALRARFAAENERDAANRDADTYRQILAGKLRRTDLAAAQNGDLMPGPVALASLVLADMIEAKPEAKNRLSWSWTDERTGKGYRVMVEHENGESFAAALAAARLDGARAMREAAAVSLESAVWTTDTRFSRVQAEEVAAIRALDPAAVVGSGS